MQTVLVTGATGCVGSALALMLHARGDRLRILRRETSDTRMLEGIAAEQFVGDICDNALLERATDGCDVVFHTAALVSFSRSVQDEQLRVNVQGTRCVAEACLARGVRTLIHTSSVTTIGRAKPGALADEDTPLDRDLAHGYKLSKVLAEDEILRAVREGLRAVILNPSVIVGERDARFHGGQLIRTVRRGWLPFAIEGGMNVVYSGDVARGMILAAERGRTGERYILAGKNQTHRQIFSRTAELIGARQPIGTLPSSWVRALGAVMEGISDLSGARLPLGRDLAGLVGENIWFSTAKAERELGFAPTSFDQTILAAYNWYRRNGYLK
ncbi:MAG TPA: NAD-dependent epimerase/dehydratase family protein [Bacteroidota bacterium]|nr:NAD-dependent epimerase/dehydratase family protein [Bacteroidota bacterium]